jgi:hypothetical protein
MFVLYWSTLSICSFFIGPHLVNVCFILVHTYYVFVLYWSTLSICSIYIGQHLVYVRFILVHTKYMFVLYLSPLSIFRFVLVPHLVCVCSYWSTLSICSFYIATTVFQDRHRIGSRIAGGVCYLRGGWDHCLFQMYVCTCIVYRYIVYLRLKDKHLIVKTIKQ